MIIDSQYLEQVLAHLVQINSVNPMLVPGAPGEREIAGYMLRVLADLGMEVQTREPEPGRVTVLGRLAGAGGGRSLMLNGHLDTVAIEGMPEPLSGAVREGRLYGRGSFDMKGSLAASVAAVKAIRESGTSLRGDLWIAAVADEEYASLGTMDLLRDFRTDGAIITEPTALDLCVAHKGYLWIEVRVEGRAAHGSKFQLGIDANMKMGRFLHALGELERDLRARPPHALVGPPSLHAALLKGGTGLSTYAAESMLTIERRTVPGETEASAMAEIQAIVDRIAAEDPDFHATIRCTCAREPFEAAPGSAIVKAVENAAARVRNAQPKRFGDTPWMDSALLQSAGVETVIFGPTGAGAHADVEWVDLASVEQAAAILAEAACEYCGVAAASAVR